MNENARIENALARAGKTQSKLSELYDFIGKYKTENGFPPSIREICRALKINSTATAFYYVNKLNDLGLVRKADGFSRGIDVTEKYPEYKKIDLRVPSVRDAAALPLFSEQNVTDAFSLSSDLFGGGELFIYETRGDYGACGILNGDKLVIRAGGEYRDGQTVLATDADGGVRIETFRADKGKSAALEKENPRVIGAVAGVIRVFKPI